MKPTPIFGFFSSHNCPITDARRYLDDLLDSGDITTEEYSDAAWILTPKYIKSWVADVVKIPPCDYIKEYARALKIELDLKWYN